MGGMNPRMNPPPRGPGMGPMGSYGPGMRGGPPNSNLGPSGGPIPPMIGGQRPWTPNTSTPMNYSSSSPGSYGVSHILCNLNINNIFCNLFRVHHQAVHRELPLCHHHRTPQIRVVKTCTP